MIYPYIKIFTFKNRKWSTYNFQYRKQRVGKSTRITTRKCTKAQMLITSYVRKCVRVCNIIIFVCMCSLKGYLEYAQLVGSRRIGKPKGSFTKQYSNIERRVTWNLTTPKPPSRLYLTYL